MDGHGGDLYGLAERYHLHVLVDYSANINPLGLPEGFIKAAGNLGFLTQYPDIHYRAERKAVAAMHGVSPNQVYLGNGSTEAIYLIVQALNAKRVLIPCPSFSEYEQASRAAGCFVKQFMLPEADDFHVPVAQITKAAQGVDLLFLGNPNNPTGRVLSLHEIEKLARTLKHTTLVIDETFLDFVPDGETAIALIEENVVVLRAFTKFFAMPGVRIGYAVAKETVIRKMVALCQPWSVNGLAALACRVLPQETAYRKQTKAWAAEEIPWFQEQLSRIPFCKVYPTSANFVLLRLLQKDAPTVRERMLQRGFLIRDASNFPALNHTYIRVAVKDRKNNERFLHALQQVMEE